MYFTYIIAYRLNYLKVSASTANFVKLIENLSYIEEVCGLFLKVCYKFSNFDGETASMHKQTNFVASIVETYKPEAVKIF